MSDGSPFEAKLQEHLRAVQAAAQAAKARVADGIAGLAPRPAPPPPPPPAPGNRHRAAVSFDEPTTVVGRPPFDPADSDILTSASDEEGIPVWEDPV